MGGSADLLIICANVRMFCYLCGEQQLIEKKNSVAAAFIRRRIDDDDGWMDGWNKRTSRNIITRTRVERLLTVKRRPISTAHVICSQENRRWPRHCGARQLESSIFHLFIAGPKRSDTLAMTTFFSC